MRESPLNLCASSPYLYRGEVFFKLQCQSFLDVQTAAKLKLRSPNTSQTREVAHYSDL